MKVVLTKRQLVPNPKVGLYPDQLLSREDTGNKVMENVTVSETSANDPKVVDGQVKPGGVDDDEEGTELNVACKPGCEAVHPLYEENLSLILSLT